MKPEIEEALKDVKNKQWELRDAYIKLESFQDLCTHKFVSSDPEDPEDSSAVCEDCGYNPGSWFCPESPNGKCKYADDDNFCDSCEYCGEPDERK